MKISPLASIALALTLQSVAGEKLLRAEPRKDSYIQENVGNDVRRDLLIPLQHIGNNGEPSSAFPLGECQGDCDNDGDCAPGLVCFQRDDDTPIPGCTGETENTLPGDFCYNPNPTASPTAAPIPNPIIAPTSAPNPFPTPQATPVPTPSPIDLSTQASDSSTIDGSGGAQAPAPTTTSLTASPSSSPSDPPTPIPSLPSGDFSLKLYWKNGYTWQESTSEKKWCVECEGSSCGDGGGLLYG